MDAERILYISEMLRTRGNGFTKKEREQIRAQYEIIADAIREIREINIKVRRSIGFK